MQIKRGGLYLVNLNPPHGTESGKIRPALVVQNDFLNDIGHPSTWVLPCTTRLTEPNILRVRLPIKSAGNEKECDVMVDQLRTIDNSRFKTLLGEVPPSFMKEVDEKMLMVGGLWRPKMG